jgi:hypothetical protein
MGNPFPPPFLLLPSSALLSFPLPPVPHLNHLLRCLIIYNHITDIRTKEIIELAQCHAYLLEAQVMKIYRPKLDGMRGMDQTWFCFCAVPNLREEWFK